MGKHVLALVVLFGMLVGMASAACEYCDNRLICEGDKIAKLLELCGQPLYTKRARVKKRGVEQWFYQNPYGALNAIRTYTIESGKIIKIE